MNEHRTANRVNWWLPFYGVLGACIVLFPKTAFGNDIGVFLITIVLAGLVSLVLLIVAVRMIRSQSLPTALMIVAFCAVSWALFRTSDDLRTRGRWLIHGNSYRTAALNQPVASNGELKHIEWDGWGFAGAGDTTVYLVFDPTDSLATAARDGSPGKFKGLPCTVLRVRKLENHWYTVLFYTDSDWDHC